MSRCRETQAFLHQTPQLDQLPPQVEAHLASCPACASCREDLGLMAAQMRALDPPQLPDGFELSLRRQLTVAAGEKQQDSASTLSRASRRKVAPLIFAAAATVLIAFGGLALWKRYSAPASVAPRYHKLHLSVRATERCDDVVFAVRLPANVALAGKLDGLVAADGTLRWRSVLKPGVNSIDLPLVATLSADDNGAKQIRAQVTAKGRTTTRTVAIPTGASANADRGGEAADGIKLAFVLPRGEGRVVQ